MSMRIQPSRSLWTQQATAPKHQSFCTALTAAILSLPPHRHGSATTHGWPLRGQPTPVTPNWSSGLRTRDRCPSSEGPRHVRSPGECGEDMASSTTTCFAVWTVEGAGHGTNLWARTLPHGACRTRIFSPITRCPRMRAVAAMATASTPVRSSCLCPTRRGTWLACVKDKSSSVANMIRTRSA